MSHTDLLNSEPEIISHTDLINKPISWEIPNKKNIYVISVNDKPTFFAKTESIAKNRILHILKRNMKDPDWTYYVETQGNTYYLYRCYKFYFVKYDHVVMRLSYTKIPEFNF